MKKLIATRRDVPWLPKPSEGRLYLSDELPDLAICSAAFGFAFHGEGLLMVRLRKRGWDIPGGRIDPGETPAAAAVREVREEACARVEIIELLGMQELERYGPRLPEDRGPFPLSAQIYYLCRLVKLEPFSASKESRERSFIDPEDARQEPTMIYYAEIYEEALHRNRAK